MFFVYDIVDDAVMKSIEDCTIVVPGMDSECYENWQTSNRDDATERWYDFYFFEVTNVAEVMAAYTTTYEFPYAGLHTPVVPQLERKGPFSYRKYGEKYDVEWEDNDNKVKYFDYAWYEFDEERSCDTCTMDTEITQANALSHIFQELAGQTDPNLQIAITTYLYAMASPSLSTNLGGVTMSMETYLKAAFGLQASNDDPTGVYACLASNLDTAAWDDVAMTEQDIYFETHTAHEWAFGYNSTTLKHLFALNDLCPQSYLSTIMGTFDITDPLFEPFQNYSLEVYREYYDNKRETVYSGKSDPAMWGRYYKYADELNSTLTHDWSSAPDGPDHPWVWDGIYQSGGVGIENSILKNGDDFKLWVSEVQRPVLFSRTSQPTYRDIPLHRYQINENELKGMDEYAPNAQWAYKSRGGIGTIQPTTMFPIYPSYSQWQGGPYAELFSPFYGLPDPDPEEIPYVDYEEITGFPVRVNKALQSNFPARRDANCNSVMLAAGVVCFRANEWAVNPEPYPEDMLYDENNPGVLYPNFLVIDSIQHTDDILDDFKGLHDLYDWLDQTEQYGWSFFILALICCCCCGIPTYMCCMAEKQENEVQFGGGTSPDTWS